VLYDGSAASYSANWTGKAPYTIGADKYLSEGNNSTKSFTDHTLHIEFRPPYQPDKDGQERGNSGVYVQGNYECQVLDSFGWMKGGQESGPHGTAKDWMGGLYAWNPARVNMAHPPLTWQTYDVHVTNAVYNGNTKTAPTHLTVYLNGYMVQDTIIAGPTPGGGQESAAGGKLYVQNHGNPMWYRNIWVLPGKAFTTVPPLPPLVTSSAIRIDRSPRARGNTLGNAHYLRSIPGAPAIFNLVGSRLTNPAAGLYVLPSATVAPLSPVTTKTPAP
jgi:hypothetical protein